MDDDEEEISFVNGIKKLVKANHPQVRVSHASLEALSKIAEAYDKKIIQDATNYLDDIKGKNKMWVMKGEHVITMIERMKLANIVEQAKKKDQAIGDKNKERSAEKKRLKNTGMTEEEQIEAQKQLRAQALEAMRQRRLNERKPQ